MKKLNLKLSGAVLAVLVGLTACGENSTTIVVPAENNTTVQTTNPATVQTTNPATVQTTNPATTNTNPAYPTEAHKDMVFIYRHYPKKVCTSKVLLERLEALKEIKDVTTRVVTTRTYCKDYNKEYGKTCIIEDFHVVGANYDCVVGANLTGVKGYSKPSNAVDGVLQVMYELY